MRTMYEADRSTTSSPSRSSRPSKADSVGKLDKVDGGVVFGSLPIIRYHQLPGKMESQVQHNIIFTHNWLTITNPLWMISQDVSSKLITQFKYIHVPQRCTCQGGEGSPLPTCHQPTVPLSIYNNLMSPHGTPQQRIKVERFLQNSVQNLHSMQIWNSHEFGGEYVQNTLNYLPPILTTIPTTATHSAVSIFC